MRNRLILAFAVLAAAAQSPAAAQQMTPHTITVTGRGEITVTPDIATIAMGVVSDAATVADAAQQNSALMTRVVAAVTKAGVAARDVQTSQYNIAPTHPANPNGSRDMGRTSGYEVTNRISVRVTDLPKLAQVIDAATQAGANSANAVNFDIRDRKAAEDAAKVVAVKDARHQAEVIAGAEGAKPGAAIAITATAVSFGGPLTATVIASSPPSPAMTPTPISPGQLRIQSSVTVQYALQ